MSIRLAVPSLSRRRLSTSHVLRLQSEAANDNRASSSAGDASFRRALDLFAQHGLGAAKVAHASAESAAICGDMEGFATWRDVCANLDRRLAHDLARFRPQTSTPM
ncbi:hypothetical protein [Aurantiacibacter suaedae]|uniref:hypothetical protein n=1 Tax=Aurantiacibacter suaedae TaxID=2545755 RepID=UPI001F5015FD|nr:hypothetical protein [Aurantiacibacter suaedae]